MPDVAEDSEGTSRPENDPKLRALARPDREGWFRGQLMSAAYEFGLSLLLWVPQSLDARQYARQLRLLDTHLLRNLTEFGSQSAAALADDLNESKKVNTRRSKTGISVMSADTAKDWLILAWRRGLVEPWPPSAAVPDWGDPGAMWVATREGRARARHLVARLLSTSPVWTVLQILLGATGIAIFTSLKKNPDVASVVVVVASIVAGYTALILVASWLGRRAAPAYGLVTIETLRCRGGLPPLHDQLPSRSTAASSRSTSSSSL